MTPLSQTILEHYQMRTTKKQRQAFLDLMCQHYPRLQLQEGSFPRYSNIIIGDIENAKVVLVADSSSSGMAVLCELLTVLTEAERSGTAFVLLEGGSSLFRSAFKKKLQRKLLIRFDSVSNGNTILVAGSKAARAEYSALLKKSFLASENKSIRFAKAAKVRHLTPGTGFHNSVTVAALKHRRFWGYYIDRSRTAGAAAPDKETVKLLCESVHRLLRKLSKFKTQS